METLAKASVFSQNNYSTDVILIQGRFQCNIYFTVSSPIKGYADKVISSIAIVHR